MRDLARDFALLVLLAVETAAVWLEEFTRRRPR